MSYLIRCITTGKGQLTIFEGMYLSRYEPEAYDGVGLVEWSEDPADAVRFESMQAARNAWLHVPTTRPEVEPGVPNRPLTAYTVEITAESER